ncbi:hypothetical protein [Cognatishimia sp. WU-CL00825]|uniref:hypothetical protein n=1 Tax=Cognatishimia sp. WU-CL00825 TaxID=3127658 RepID=UPI00336575B2
MIEICAKGGNKVRDEYAKAFAKNFTPENDARVEAPRRNVLLHNLRSAPDFAVEPADGIESIEVSSLNFYFPGGGFSRFECRGQGETIYQFLDKQFADHSPLKAKGWTIIGAAIRIVLRAVEGKRRKTLTVTLNSPNTTTLPNKTDLDRHITLGLLEFQKRYPKNPHLH